MRCFCRYRIEENYKGKINGVNVTEWRDWKQRIQRASLLCLENQDGIIFLSAKTGNPISLGNSIILPIISELTTGDVDKEIIQQLKKTEQLFDKEKDINYELEHYDFEKRFLKLIYEYRDNEMILNLYINFVNGNVYFIDEDENVIATSTLENDEYRKFIYSYISYFEQIVDYNLSESKEDTVALLHRFEEYGSFRTFLRIGFYSFWYCFTGKSEEECYKAICGRQKKIKFNYGDSEK